LGEAVAPWANREAKRLWNEDVRRLTAPRSRKYENVTVAGKGVFYAIGLLDIDGQILKDVVIDLSEEGRPHTQWQAKDAFWTPQGWKLKDGVERIYSPDGLTIQRQKPFKEKNSRRREKPADLLPQEPDTDEMNRSSLARHIERLQLLGVPTHKLEVELHMKGALPWANLIVILIGVPFAFNKRGGKVKAIGLALAVAFSYFGLMQVGRALGQKPWCPPFVGAWLANLMFLAIGLRSYWKMKSLG
jgi:lipopolysaccharide export system permease protein